MKELITKQTKEVFEGVCGLCGKKFQGSTKDEVTYNLDIHKNSKICKKKTPKIKAMTLLLFLGIFMLSTVMSLSAGESMVIETNFTNPVYTVFGNSSDLDGLNISFDNAEITVSIPENYKPDNFTLIFFDEITKEVIKRVSSGGSSRTKYIDNNITVYVPEYVDVITNVCKATEAEEIAPIILEAPDKYKTFFFVLLAISILLIVLMFIKLKGGNENE